MDNDINQNLMFFSQNWRFSKYLNLFWFNSYMLNFVQMTFGNVQTETNYIIYYIFCLIRSLLNRHIFIYGTDEWRM